ncbi:MAG: phosphoglycerate dehydrogenase [Angelakisella sp.]|nr:phosphoglycerate dehydrogenase [Angelakisella sp.]
MRILITDTMYCTDAGKKAATQISEKLGDVIVNPIGRKLTSLEILGLWNGIDVIIAGTEEYDSELLSQAPKSLKLISRNGVSYENIDLQLAAQKEIAVTTVRGANATTVADSTMALLLSVARRLPSTDKAVRAGCWNAYVSDDINHKTLGILGFGAIGKEVAKRALGFDMTVLAHSPPCDFDYEFAIKYSIKEASVEEILRQSDFVTLHMPVLPETREIINYQTLTMMKPSAYLINTSRGALINENDLYVALKNGMIRGAALDVFKTEPVSDSPLFELENTVLSPHCAGLSVNTITEMGRINIDNILAISQGKSCDDIILGPFPNRWK